MLSEKLRTYSCVFEHARVNVVLPRLRILELDELNVHPPPCGNSDGPSSFTLRAPRLRWLYWQNQFAERVRIDVGKPGSVEGGLIELVSIYTCELKFYQEQMMRMLRGLLPDVPPESIDDVTRPYRTQEKYEDGKDSDEEEATEEKITCDLTSLMSRALYLIAATYPS
ncbi:hypothetical protein ACP4OV_006956 [Aristida adscensionis]